MPIVVLGHRWRGGLAQLMPRLQELVLELQGEVGEAYLEVGGAAGAGAPGGAPKGKGKGKGEGEGEGGDGADVVAVDDVGNWPVNQPLEKFPQ